MKTVVLDLCEIGNPASGFGQICRNYARLFSQTQDPDLSFKYLVPEKYAGPLPQGEVYRVRRKFHKFFSQGLPQGDVWHCTNQQQLKRRRGSYQKLVLTIHDLNYLTEKNRLRQWKHHFILQRAIRQAAAVTCISGFVAEQVKQQFHLYGKPLRVIYNGVEDITSQPQQKPQWAGGRPFFFSIGQIRTKKNFHLLVDLMRHFPEYDLYICGDDHFPYSRVVREHIQSLPTQNARLCGKISQEEKVWLYAHCQAFLFPSVGEGFGLPVIEAMQFGKPVFISTATCLPEIAGDAAFTWESLEPNAMAERVKQGLSAFTPMMAEHARQHAQEFSYERHIAEYLKLYNLV